MGYNPALESIFANAEQQAASLIDNITLSINEKVNDIDSAEELVIKLSNEAARFNKILVSLDNAKSQLESGDITKEECLGIVVPFVKELKEQCTALGMSEAELSGDEDIDTQEIAVLREIIIGAKAAAEARVVALRTDADLTPDTESLSVNSIYKEENTMDFENVEVAQEAIGARHWFALRNSTEAKTAKALKSNAKKLYSAGSRDKAKEYMKKAQSLYQKCLDKAKKEAKMFTAERTLGNKVIGMGEDKYKKEVTEDFNAATLIVYFEEQVDSCRAYLQQWDNKAGNKSIKELKAAMKEERKSERARIKQEKKDARAAAKANESYDEFGYFADLTDNEMDFFVSIESTLDALEAEILDPAMEAEGEGEEKTGLGSKIRAAISKLKNGKKEGGAELKSATSELKSAAASAKTPEEKKKIITLCIIAAIAIAGMVTYLIISAKKNGGKPDAIADLQRLRSKITEFIGKLRKDKKSPDPNAVAAANAADSLAQQMIADASKVDMTANFRAATGTADAEKAANVVRRGEAGSKDALAKSIHDGLSNKKASNPSAIVALGEKAEKNGIELTSAEKAAYAAAKKRMGINENKEKSASDIASTTSGRNALNPADQKTVESKAQNLADSIIAKHPELSGKVKSLMLNVKNGKGTAQKKAIDNLEALANESFADIDDTFDALEAYMNMDICEDTDSDLEELALQSAVEAMMAEDGIEEDD